MVSWGVICVKCVVFNLLLIFMVEKGLKVLMFSVKFCCRILMRGVMVVVLFVISSLVGCLVCSVDIYICNVWLIFCCKLVVKRGRVLFFYCLERVFFKSCFLMLFFLIIWMVLMLLIRWLSLNLCFLL